MQKRLLKSRRYRPAWRRYRLAWRRYQHAWGIRRTKPCKMCGWSGYRFPFLGWDRYANIKSFRKSHIGGCVGCGMALTAIETIRPGWMAAHEDDGRVRVSGMGPSGPFMVDITDAAQENPYIYSIFKVLGGYPISNPFASTPYTSPSAILVSKKSFKLASSKVHSVSALT
jgi:hypothetical protein